MKSKVLTALVMVVMVAGSTFAADTQKFTVVVPTSISVTAPNDVSIIHDETDSDQAFPNQEWVVRGNVLDGVNVSFSTDRAFTNTADSYFKRDAALSLSVASVKGPAHWTVNQATDTTDYSASDEIATVLATSNGVGRATFNVGVTFVTDSYGTFAAGDYEMTLTGTVSAN